MDSMDTIGVGLSGVLGLGAHNSKHRNGKQEKDARCSSSSNTRGVLRIDKCLFEWVLECQVSLFGGINRLSQNGYGKHMIICWSYERMMT